MDPQRSKKKKIAITILRGWLARNLLHSDFYRIVHERYDVVLLTPAYADDRFVKEFGHPNVRFLPFDEIDWKPIDRFITNIHRFLIWNRSVELHLRYGVAQNDRGTSLPVYLLAKAIFYPLSRIGILRSAIRRFDYYFLQRKEVAAMRSLVDGEGFDLVIATHPTSDAEAALIKACRKSGIEVWAMPKSWDNPSKSSFRAKADRLIVWGEYMKEKSIEYQNYRADEVDTIGVLQYDVFAETDKLTRYEDFCREFGLSPERRTIFYGSEGKLIPRDKEIATIIYEMIEKDEFVVPCQLLIRPHYGHKNDERKFEHLKGKSHIAIDLYNVKSKIFKDEWDYSDAFTYRWFNSLRHSSVIINTRSSLSMDASALDRPGINIGFDGYETNVPYGASVERMNDYDFYRELLDTGGTKLARSREQLRDAINAYLNNPSEDAVNRANLRARYCGPVDGNSGKRFANLVIDMLDNHTDNV